LRPTELTFKYDISAGFSRKIRAGDAGLSQFDLAYKYDIDKSVAFKAGYSQFLSAGKGNSLSVGLVKAFE
jgi:hypothetical protein